MFDFICFIGACIFMFMVWFAVMTICYVIEKNQKWISDHFEPVIIVVALIIFIPLVNPIMSGISAFENSISGGPNISAAVQNSIEEQEKENWKSYPIFGFSLVQGWHRTGTYSESDQGRWFMKYNRRRDQ